MSFIIMSCEKSELSPEENIKRIAEFNRLAGKYAQNYHVAAGCYEGTKEISFIWESAFLPALRLAHHFKQKSVLYVADDSSATLIFLGDSYDPVSLGKFTFVSRQEAIARRHKGYTEYKGVYYVCK